MPVLKPNFISKLYSRMITRKLPIAEKQVAKEMEILFNRYKWTDPKTGLIRNVYFGNEFDPYYIHETEGQYAGLTNIARMKQKLPPVGYDIQSVNQHHVMQNADGDLVFLSKTTHTKYSKLLHSKYGYGSKNPEYPVEHHGGNWTRIRQSINQFIAKILENGK